MSNCLVHYPWPVLCTGVVDFTDLFLRKISQNLNLPSFNFLDLCGCLVNATMTLCIFCLFVSNICEVGTGTRNVLSTIKPKDAVFLTIVVEVIIINNDT